jgi:uncharacterized membrane protein YoaK (UPF0700 family)
MLVHEGEARSPATDRRLALSLAAVAGALNTAGFYAVGLYASNMTGNVSAVADRTGTGDFALAGEALLLIVLFVTGSAASTLLIRHLRRRARPGAYAYSVCAEALLLAATGLAALPLGEAARGQVLVIGLSFALGVQNAAVTKISEARVRTTHVTGMITDIGIELARRLDGGARAREVLKPHDPDKFRLHLLTVGAFLAGGLAGVATYRLAGVAMIFAAAAILAALAIPALVRRPAMRS